MPGTDSALEPEWSLLRIACSSDENNKSERVSKLLRSPIRWKPLLELADRHSVQPLLCQSLLNVPAAIPAQARDQLKQCFQVNLHKSLLLSRELIRILGHLATRGIEVMPYKGLALAESLYGDIALRQAGDIDLLIRSRDIAGTCEALRELGYTPHQTFSKAEERAYLQSGYEYSFDGEAGPNLLEVQWAIQPKFYSVDLGVDILFQRAVRTSVAGYPIKTPCDEDLFIVLALHAAKHVWAKLIWLCDLERLMKRPALNWPTIGSHAARLGVVRILRVTMLLANCLLGAELPVDAEANLPTDPLASQLANQLQQQVGTDSTPSVDSLAYFRLMVGLRERFADQARFLSRLTFTPGPGEWAAVRLPPPLFPLYRLVRLSRLAARAVKS